MAQRYKLRLSDGTVLLVDQDGLSAWLEDAKVMVQAGGSGQWRPLREFVRELQRSANRTARQESNAGAALPLTPPPPKVREEERLSAPPPPPSEPPEIPTIEELPGLQVLAHDPAVPPEKPASHPWAPEEGAAAIPAGPLDGESPLRPAAPSWRDSLEPPLLGASSSLQVLADDPVAQSAGDRRETSRSDDPGPVMRFKPLDDDEAPAYEFEGPGDDEHDAGEVDEEVDEEVHHDRLEGPLLHVLSALGSFLSVGLTRLDRLGRRWSSESADARQRWRAAASSRSAEQEPPPSVGLRTKVQIPAADSMASPVPYTGKLSTDDGGLPVIPLKPLAPPISELPVLRLADTHEREEVADIFEAEDGESFFPIAWLWTKRVVLLAALVAAGVYASLTWETWFPMAAVVGQRMFAGIDNIVRSRDQAERQQHALLVATEQLPHLSPQTVRLVLSGSPTGDLDPPEVFRLAWEAADRGLTALTPGQTEELRALRGQLLATLRPTERGRILEYDRARAHRATFAFEDRRVLDLFARAARALPAPNRQRLQALLERAVAAGLVPPTEVAPLDTATR